MNRLLATTAAATLLIAAGTAPAYATTIAGSYTLTESISDATNSTGGGPVVTGDLGLTGDDPASPVHVVNSSTGTTGNFSFSLNTGQSTAVQNLAPFAPDATCQGPGCSGGTETDALTLTFNFTSPSGAGTASDTGTFTAKYARPYLACDPGGDGAGKSDCVQWASASNPIVVHFTDGAVMDITLGNASDWNITPTVQFTLVSGRVPVPAPVIGHGM